MTIVDVESTVQLKGLSGSMGWFVNVTTNVFEKPQELENRMFLLFIIIFFLVKITIWFTESGIDVQNVPKYSQRKTMSWTVYARCKKLTNNPKIPWSKLKAKVFTFGQ